MPIIGFRKAVLLALFLGLAGVCQPVMAEDAATDDFKPEVNLEAQDEDLVITDDISTAEAQVLAHPDDPEAHFLAAAAYSRSPQHVIRAYDHVQKVKKLLKANKDFPYIDRTIKEYETLLQDRPQDPVLMYRLAMAYYFRGFAMERHPERFTENPLGDANGYYKQAKSLATQLIEMDPNDIAARNYLGYLVYDKEQNVDKAITIWKESLQVTDQNPGAYFLLGQAYLKTGDLKNAMIYGAKGISMQQQMGIKGL